MSVRDSAESFLASQQEELDKLEQEYKANPTNEAAGDLLKQASRVAIHMEAQGKNSSSVAKMLDSVFPHPGPINLYTAPSPSDSLTKS